MLAISGEHDTVTTPASMQDLADDVPGGRHEALDGASHLAVLEEPMAAAELIAEHLDRARGAAEAAGAHDRGMRVRREVLGDAHVDRADRRARPPRRPRSRTSSPATHGARSGPDPSLSRRERSIATLASLTTGGHEDEIAMHVRAAQRNGLSRDEIAEVLLHTALYAGLPAANAALAIARDVFAEEPMPASDTARPETSDTAPDPADDGDTHG